MTRDPITVKPETDILSCAKRMIKKKVGSLIIVDEKKVIGFLSEKDILWALTKKPKADLSKIKAIEISPKKIYTIKPNFTIQETVKKMKKLKLDKFPVIKKEKLLGMVTIKDILNFHPEIYSELDEFAKIREEKRKLEKIKKSEERSTTDMGICEECGEKDYLYKFNDILICESCKESI